MKKIGVIGGMGPESTIVFYQEIVKIFQKKFNAKYDSDYPEMMISNLPIPDIVENLQNPDIIIRMIRENSKKLENAGMDFIVIPCNTVNLFYDKFSRGASIPILNIIEEAVKKVKSSGYRNVGLLATETTIKNRLYEKWFEKFNINQMLPIIKDRIDVNKIILNILNGKKLNEDRKKLENVMDVMVECGAEG